jgi:hypothetical protein
LIDRTKKVPAFLYESASGNRPVREWILGLSPEDRKRLGRDIQKVEFGWPLGLPYCRSLGSGRRSHWPPRLPCPEWWRRPRLWEVRSDFMDGKIGRVIF